MCPSRSVYKPLSMRLSLMSQKQGLDTFYRTYLKEILYSTYVPYDLRAKHRLSLQNGENTSLKLSAEPIQFPFILQPFSNNA